MRRLLTICLLLILSAALPADAYPRPGRTERVTVTPSGQPGAGPDSFFGRRGDARVAISQSGRLVAFDTRLTDLVSGDENEAYDVFVRDLHTGLTERVSVPTGGGEANGHSYWPAISPDGRFVAFESEASNLVEGDTNGRVDVFVHDRISDRTELVSVTAEGTGGGTDSTAPSISADGRFVSFSTNGTSFVPGDDNLCTEVMVKDRETGALELVTATPSGQPSDGVCTYGVASDISADGRYVAFETQMHDLVPDDRNVSWDIFVRDLETDTTERVSVAGDESEANYVSYAPSVSADGRFVSFYSCASNLVPDDTNSSGTKVGGVLGANNCFDVFVRDRAAGRTERVSVSSTGAEGGFASTWTDISADGRYVAFQSQANLAAGATDFLERVYVHDRSTRQTDVVSFTSEGGPMPSASWSSAPALSGDGRYVAFNTGTHVWRRDRGPAIGVGGMSISSDASTASVSGWLGLSGVQIAGASDPANDATDPGSELGGELIGAEVIYRPEEKDLLVRFRVASLPGARPSAAGSNYVVPARGGTPGLLHTLAFTSNGTSWQVRAIRLNAEEPAVPPSPLLSLWKCDPSCRESAHLQGGYGSTGEEIVAAVPISSLANLQQGAALTQIRAESAVGDSLTGGLSVVDSVDLPAAELPRSEVRLGVAPSGSDPGSVQFDSTVGPVDGGFQGSVSTEGLVPGTYELWAQGCLGSVCGPPLSSPFTR